MRKNDARLFGAAVSALIVGLAGAARAQSVPTTLQTIPDPAAVTLSAFSVTLRDIAMLSGGSNPTGAIQFILNGPGGATDSETVVVSGNGTYETPTGFTLPTTGSVVGTYSWAAVYSGDTNNLSSSESGELTIVSPASPGLNTTTSGGVLVGSILTDSAILSGGYFPEGTIDFTLNGPGGTAVDTETVTVSGNGTYTTPTGFLVPTNGAGTYSWIVGYLGDANNNRIFANPESVTVTASVPEPSTWAMMLLGFAGLGFAGHRLRRSAVVAI